MRCPGLPLDERQTLTWKYSLEIDPAFDEDLSRNQFEANLLFDMTDTLLSCSNPVRLRRRLQNGLGINALEFDPADVLALDESKFISFCC